MFGNSFLTKLKHKKALDSIKDEHLQHLIKERFTLFGSRRWGGAQESSDYDYIGNKQDLEYLLDFLKRHDIPYKTDAKGTYKNLILDLDYIITFRLNKTAYQFCIPTRYDNDKFMLSAKIMNAYSVTHDMSSRKVRHRTFEDIIRFIKYPNHNSDNAIFKFLQENYPEYLI